jgi:hypothetical protein
MLLIGFHGQGFFPPLPTIEIPMSIFRTCSISVSNYLAQRRNPDVKIFFIGFNKCATTAIHRLMAASGIRSIHWERRRGKNIALEIEAALRENRLKEYGRRFTALSDPFYFASDRIVEANRYFREFHHAFPNAYFILNDRNVESWIKSRLGHRKGDLLRRFRDFHKAGEDDVKEIWRNDHASHLREVLDHFAGHDRFLHFLVDRDPPKVLTDFLAPTFRIDPDRWTTVNATKVRTVRQRLFHDSVA